MSLETMSFCFEDKKVFHENRKSLCLYLQNFSFISCRFGAKLISPSTGIILNDGMDDFATPGINNSFGLAPSPANFIRPKKIPLSSMCPTIIVDADGDVRFGIGSAGGAKITTAVVYVSI